MSRLRDEELGLVGKGIVILLVIVALAGLALVEGGSILFTRLQVQDLAQAAAVEGAATFRRTGNAASAESSAAKLVDDRDPAARITKFTLLPDGQVTITLCKEASTLVLDRLDSRATCQAGSRGKGADRSLWRSLAELSVVRATETARPPTL
ncbi:MAG: hypothetical protein HY658_04815 [Actinobacteria bacterium]|nr:hypothetical protein [Actinomycetota bacterium]